jgi:hypothetical protein
MLAVLEYRLVGQDDNPSEVVSQLSFDPSEALLSGRIDDQAGQPAAGS